MSEPAIFVLIHDGQKQYFADHWAHSSLHREIAWGPEALETWLAADEEIDDWSDEASGGVVVDFDNQRMVWYGEDSMLSVPRVAKVFDQLLQAAWPGYEIKYASRGLMDLAEAAGEPDAEDYDDELHSRSTSVRDAAGIYWDDDDEDEEVEYEFDEDNPHAWVTLIDSEGAVRHRRLSEVSSDLIHGHASGLNQLAELPAAEIPEESIVTEGMWIDQSCQEIGFWGNRKSVACFEQIQKSWEGWNVKWAEEGYSDQCSVSGPSGVPMTEEQALGKVIPTILSTQRLDARAIFGAMGGQIKKMAVKATGCLLLVICSPVLIYGAISGSWQAALITVAIVAAIVFTVFKVLETKFKRNFAVPSLQQEEEEETRPTAAGSLKESERRRVLDQILTKAGLPSLAKIEPHFDFENTLDGLLS